MNKYIITLLLCGKILFAQGTNAGTKIINVAHLDYKIDSIEFSAVSNELVDIVDQKLDMQMVCQESSSVIVEAEDVKRPMQFMLKNNGNGEDRYIFTPIEGEDVGFSVSNIEVYEDNGDGLFSIVEDKPITKLSLKADESALLFFVSNIPKSAKGLSENGLKVDSEIQDDLVYGESRLLDDFYAVVATQEEAKSDFCVYEVPSIELKLEKKSTLSSDKLYKRTTIHYTIEVKAEGVGTLENIVIKDVIPEGTVYVSGTLKLDGQSVDGFDGNEIAVTIDSIHQEEESTDVLHRVTFDVIVQ